MSKDNFNEIICAEQESAKNQMEQKKTNGKDFLSPEGAPRNDGAGVKTKDPKKLIKTLVGIIMALVFIVGFAVGYLFTYLTKSDSAKKYEDIIRIAIEKGIDSLTDELGKTLTEDQFAKLLVALILAEDEYAEYYTEEEYKKLQAEGDGNYTGIGISITEDSLAIYKVINNSPAEIAGLKAGDTITAAKTALNEFTVFSTSEELNGYLEKIEEGTPITFKVTRKGEFTDREFVVEKSKYIASYITFADNQGTYLAVSDDNREVSERNIGGGMAELADDTLYIKISQFQGEAAVQFAYAMTKLKSEQNPNGKTKLMLDLRDNGGGYVSIAVSIASYLIYNDGEQFTLLTYIREKNRTSHESTQANNFNTEIQKITVLANGNSASASELVLGAMIYYADKSNQTFSKDNLVIEKNANGVAKTYGKGIMQTTYTLTSGGALKLTTATLYWPDNQTTIHGTGILPSLPENAVEKGGAVARAVEILAIPSTQPQPSA